MAEILEARVIQKVGTEAEWLQNTLPLLDGEAAIVRTGDGTPVNLKFGLDGKTFAELPYFIDYSQAAYVEISSNTLPAPTQEVGYGFANEGTYTFGASSYTVPEGHWGMFSWNGTTWSLKDMGSLPTTPIADEVIDGGTEATSQDAVFKYVKNKLTDYISPVVEFGGISTANGSLVENTIRARTKDYISLNYAKNIKIIEGDLLIRDILFYNGTSFVSYKQINNTEFVPIIPEGADSFKITFRNVNDTEEISEQQLQDIKVNFYSDSEIDIPELNTSVLSIKNDYNSIVIDFNKDIKVEFGGISTSSGENSSPNTIRIRYINHVYLQNGDYSIVVPDGFIVARQIFYKDGVFVRYKLGNTFTIDDTVNSIRVSFSKTDDTESITQGELNSFSTSIDNITEDNKLSQMAFSINYLKKELDNLDTDDIDNFFKGAIMDSLGDSITYGFIPRNYAGYPGQLNSWAKQVASLLGMSFINHGISGSTLGQVSETDTTTRSPMIHRISALNDNAKLVTFMGGTNDLRNISVLGEMEDRIGWTYYGALHILIQGLLNKYIYSKDLTLVKDMLIVGVTPIQLYPNNTYGGFKIKDYVDAFKEVCAYYSIPCFDAWALSGLTPNEFRTLQGTEPGYTDMYNPLITDGVHPTNEGNAIWAQRFVGFLKSLV